MKKIRINYIRNVSDNFEPSKCICCPISDYDEYLNKYTCPLGRKIPEEQLNVKLHPWTCPAKVIR